MCNVGIFYLFCSFPCLEVRVSCTQKRCQQGENTLREDLEVSFVFAFFSGGGGGGEDKL